MTLLMCTAVECALRITYYFNLLYIFVHCCTLSYFRFPVLHVDAGNHTQIAISVMAGQRPDMKELNVQKIDPQYQIETGVVPLMRKCWSQKPEERPEFTGMCASICQCSAGFIS